MKLEEIVDAGIAIEGDLCVKEWDPEAEDYVAHFEGHTFAETAEYKLEGVLAKEVKYIYAIDDVTAHGEPTACLVIEVGEEF